MKVLGIISEYNPFHNGHLYHLKKSLELTGATHSVAIMSGNFLQRGEPALINKWARASMAVASGVDLVIELPVVYSCRSAEAFAFGALSILDKTSTIDCLCFASESGNLDKLQYISDILSKEPEQFKTLLRFYLSKGDSFPAARSKALYDYTEDIDSSISMTIHSPNNILALEYLKAIKIFNSSIKPYTIKRIKAGYNSLDVRGKIASASAIRNEILFSEENINRIYNVIPESSMEILNNEFMHGRGPVYENLFSNQIIGNLRKLKPEVLTQYPDISEGLEFKISDSAKKYSNISGMLKEIKSKRYTLTRLKRIMIYILLEIHLDMLDALKANGFPGYVRVLAFNIKGKDILRKMKSNSTIPIITKTARYRNHEEVLPGYIMEKDLLSTDIYVMGYSNARYAFAGQDFLTSPIFLENSQFF